jgi:hypothetical protein
VDEDAALLQVLLDDVVEIVEEDGDVLLLAVQQRVHDVRHALLVADVLHIPRGSHHWVGDGVPVAMLFWARKGRSRAACASPMKRWLPVGVCV